MSNPHVGLLFHSEKQGSLKILLLADVFYYKSYSWNGTDIAHTVYEHLI